MKEDAGQSTARRQLLSVVNAALRLPACQRRAYLAAYRPLFSQAGRPDLVDLDGSDDALIGALVTTFPEAGQEFSRTVKRAEAQHAAGGRP